jgi:hypothetical protein
MAFTLIDVANDVLLKCGERPLPSLNNTIGAMVKSAIRTALIDVCNLSDWYWARIETIATAWVGNIATLPEITQRIRGVAYDAGGGRFDLLFIPESEFIKLPDSPYSDASNRAYYFSPITDKQVRISPYPTNTTEQAKIWFYITQWVDSPSTDSGVFTVIPDPYLELVIIRAAYLFGTDRSADVAKLTEFNKQYEARALQLRGRNTAATSLGGNMYKGWRRA